MKIFAIILLVAFLFVALWFLDIFDPLLSVEIRKYYCQYFVVFDKQRRLCNYVQLCNQLRIHMKNSNQQLNPAFFADAPLGLFKSSTVKQCASISPAQKESIQSKDLLIEKLQASNYLSIEFKYRNAILSYINIYRALLKMKHFTKGQVVETLVFVKGDRCVIIGNPQIENKIAMK
ncbi:Hypothetical_protein [Hexamita inflata]|uniref:Hypothetical_protein n=1 Tax=Hexamita inflata TaxID=28002 RepID=A0ABP1GDQ8_9EUKA